MLLRTRATVLALLVILVVPAVAQKLPYPQREAVRRQSYNIKKVDRGLHFFSNLDALAAQNPLPRQVKAWMNSLDSAESLCDSIINDLDKSGCQKSHPKIAQMHASVADFRKRIAAARKGLRNIGQAATEASSVSSHQDYQKDLAQAEMIVKTHKIMSFRGGNVDQTADIVRNLPRALQWQQERWQHYQAFMKRGTAEGNRLRVKLKWAGSVLSDLQKKVAQFRQSGPRDIQRYLDEAEKWMARAQEKKNPLMLKGGVSQAQERAEHDLKILAAVLGDDDATVNSFQARLAAQRKNVAALRTSMKEEILTSTRAPAASYSGADRPKLEKMVRAAWAKAWPEDEILEIRFHRNEWKRNHKVVWNSAEKAWHETDKSYIACLVIVKTSDTVATMYPAYINKDNLTGSMNAGVRTKSGEYVVREMLLKNLK